MVKLYDQSEDPDMMEDAIKVLVVDDHPMLRAGIVATVNQHPGIEVVGEAASAIEGIDAFERLRPDVTLMDIQMPGASGIHAISKIRDLFPSAVIIVLTTFGGDAQALRALRAGAAGYILKDALRKDLIDAIRAVHAGKRAIAPEIAHAIAVHAIEERLTEREIEVLGLVAEGQANKEIARNLKISPETIKACLKSIFAKLGVDDRTHAVIIAARRGLIEI